MGRTIWDSVGNTPLIYLQKLSEMTGCQIYAKAEFLNPGGSVKDRTAKGMIFQAEEEGLLGPGGTIVEGTAGNTGIGLATLAAERGYNVIITMPDNQSIEKLQTLEILGAKVIPVPACPFSNPEHFYHQAKRLAQKEKNAFWANQFENKANANFHFRTTGPEIWEQMFGHIDAFTCSVGTGGTMGGVSRYLKMKNPSIQIIAADPIGSGVNSYVKEGTFTGTGSSITEGIGIKRLTSNLKEAVMDDACVVSDQDMINMLFFLSQKCGLFVGTSSALNVYSAYLYACKHQGSGKKIVTILCDHGSRYASKLLKKGWLESKGLRPQTIPSPFQCQET